MNKTYCPSLTEYKRRVARVVNIGGVPMGGDYPIRVQSMTTVDTMDTHSLRIENTSFRVYIFTFASRSFTII